jgi:hypothetical protein
MTAHAASDARTIAGWGEEQRERGQPLGGQKREKSVKSRLPDRFVAGSAIFFKKRPPDRLARRP